MKRLLAATVMGLAALTASQAQASDVGVSISIGQPGFYGRIDLGNAPAPRLIYTQPVWVERGPSRLAPIYLRVPPGHERNWKKHCSRYGACGQPVYFVRDDWYRNNYVPYYREHHDHDGWRDERRDNRRDDRRDDRHDRRDDRRDDRGHGNGHGHGKGRD